jgi:transcription antitermination factor NusG
MDAAKTTRTELALHTLATVMQMPAEYLEPRWYAVYTCANHEKRVASQFALRTVEHFLPLFATIRRWKDRRKRLELPLFSGYLFARLALRDRLRVLEIPSVVKLVGFNGRPAALSEVEIETLRRTLAPQLRAQPHPYLNKGKRVRIVNGPLAGAEGILVREKSGCRVVLSLDLIRRAASVEVDVADVERIL